MAKPSVRLIQALRNTSAHLLSSSDYQWGHMGSCNCGFLAQQITRLGKNEIHSLAMQRYGDWNEQLNDFCPMSGFALDSLISVLLDFGFDIDDLKHLERLSDFDILKTLRPEDRNLKYNVKLDVVKYLNAWACSMESQFAECIELPIQACLPVEI